MKAAEPRRGPRVRALSGVPAAKEAQARARGAQERGDGAGRRPPGPLQGPLRPAVRLCPRAAALQLPGPRARTPDGGDGRVGPRRGPARACFSGNVFRADPAAGDFPHLTLRGEACAPLLDSVSAVPGREDPGRKQWAGAEVVGVPAQLSCPGKARGFTAVTNKPLD